MGVFRLATLGVSLLLSCSSALCTTHRDQDCVDGRGPETRSSCASALEALAAMHGSQSSNLGMGLGNPIGSSLVKPVRKDKDLLLIIGPGSPIFDNAVKGIEREVGGNFRVRFHGLVRGSYSRELERFIISSKPDLLVLMDNPAILFYRLFLKKHPERPALPAISLMALFVQDAAGDLPNMVGLDFQAPAVRAISKLRELVEHPLRRIAVIYQERYKETFLLEQSLCLKENIQLVGFPIEDEPSPQKRKKHLKNALSHWLGELVKNEVIDGLWIFNDSYLLSSSLLKEVWAPLLTDYQKPIIVGAEPLMNFGNFGMLTDFEELGIRVSELADEIKANGWQVKGTRVQQPFSPQTIINADFARRYLSLREEKLAEVDKVIHSGRRSQ